MKPTALISVSNKEGIADFANGLINLGWNIISSGGTAKALKAANVPVQDISEITGQGPILNHRVVTLHPHIHGGLLAAPDQLTELQELGYPYINLVCVDLYPLKEAIARTGSTPSSVLESTDIGGPTMLRSGAKGRRIVVCYAEDRMLVLDWIRAGCPDREKIITLLAAKAEAFVADYCRASAVFQLMQGIQDGLQRPEANISGILYDTLRASTMSLLDRRSDPVGKNADQASMPR